MLDEPAMKISVPGRAVPPWVSTSSSTVSRVRTFLFSAWCMEDAISKHCSGSDTSALYGDLATHEAGEKDVAGFDQIRVLTPKIENLPVDHGSEFVKMCQQCAWREHCLSVFTGQNRWLGAHYCVGEANCFGPSGGDKELGSSFKTLACGFCMRSTSMTKESLPCC